MSEALLSVDDVSLVYGRREVVYALTFAVAPNQVLGIIGPNGAGKTTVLRAIAGLISPADGHIRVRGMPALPGPRF